VDGKNNQPTVGMTHVIAGGQVLDDGGSGSHFGSLGEFETRPDWVPGLDKRRRAAPITLKTIRRPRFDHSAIWAAKVRNVSRLGSQIKSTPYRQLDTSHETRNGQTVAENVATPPQNLQQCTEPSTKRRGAQMKISHSC
jgi:hypothetical protein